MSNIDARNLYEQMKKETVPCNLCGTTDLVDVVSCDRYGMGLCTVMCKNCGFLFTNPRPIEAEMNRFYRESYRDFYFSAPDPKDRKYLTSEVRSIIVRRANWLFNFVKPELDKLGVDPVTILDVGCGEGIFLQIVRSKIPSSKLFGFDPSQAYARLAADVSKADVYVGDIESFVKTNQELAGHFNMIVLSHVLEHLYNPLEKLMMLRKLLASNGLICVEIPNLLSPHWRGNGMFHIAHINHFTPSTIRLTFAKSGFECIRSFHGRHPVDPWAMTYLCRKIDKPRNEISFPALTKKDSVLLVQLIRKKVYEKNFSTSRFIQSIRKVFHAVKKQIILPLLKELRRLAIGDDITSIETRLNKLNDKLDKLQKLLDIIANNPKLLWLYKNRLERMDATVEFFDEARRAFHLARYEFASKYVAGKVVADIACGTGYGTELMVNAGKARKAIGVDIDIETINYAKGTHMPEGVEYVCASGDATGILDKSVDVVVSFETIEHVPDETPLLREVHRILRPGGILICSTPNNWPLDIAPYHVRVYDRYSFEAALSGCFESIELYNQNSGNNSSFNHGQPVGIRRTKPENETTAECYIAVCTKRTFV